MESNCLVSVIIPVYNVAPYLREAMDSVVNQTYENLEILVVDDGSTDGSGKICDEYAQEDNRIIVIHQENKGLSAARNVGLDLMTGEVVAFLDPDDAFYPNYIRALVFTMIHEESDIVICKYSIQKTTGLLEYDVIGEDYPKINEGLYNRDNSLRAIADGMINVPVWNKIYRRELWREIRFIDGHVYEDTYATLGVFEICQSVYVLDQPLYAHRRHSGSITAIQSCINERDKVLAYAYRVSFIEERMPEVFTLEQLERRYKIWIDQMISAYLHFSKEKTNEAKQFTAELRKMIAFAGRESKVGIEKCGLRTRILY